MKEGLITVDRQILLNMISQHIVNDAEAVAERDIDALVAAEPLNKELLLAKHIIACVRSVVENVHGQPLRMDLEDALTGYAADMPRPEDVVKT